MKAETVIGNVVNLGGFAYPSAALEQEEI